VVDAIGGLDVTLLCPIYSREAGGLNLPAGVNHLDGKTAVEVARARKGDGLGDGSDLYRINRQHALFNAMLQKVYAMNYVTDFPKLYSFVGAVIDSVTTDLGNNLADIAGFGYSLRNLSMKNVTFTTVPVVDAGDGAHVRVSDYRAEPMWDALRNDQPLPSDGTTSTSDQTTTPPPASGVAPTSTPTSSPTPSGPPPIQTEADCDW